MMVLLFLTEGQKSAWIVRGRLVIVRGWLAEVRGCRLLPVTPAMYPDVTIKSEWLVHGQ